MPSFVIICYNMLWIIIIIIIIIFVSDLFKISCIENLNIISIKNKYGKIRGQCYVGHHLKQECDLKPHGVDIIWPIFDQHKLLINKHCQIYCRKHKKICELYFYDKNELNHYECNKIYLNYDEGDYIENGPKFWTIPAWDSLMPHNKITRYKQRLNVTNSFLMSLHQTICFQSM